MNEKVKRDLLLAEASDLARRAQDLVDLLRAEQREAWNSPLESAANHLGDARKELAALSAPKLAPIPTPL